MAPPLPNEVAIAGTFTFEDGDPAVGLRVELFTANPNRTSDRFLRPAFTDTNGWFAFEQLEADCYLIRAEVPSRALFADGTDLFEQHTCVDPGQVDDAVDAELVVDERGRFFTLNLLHIADHRSHIGPSVLELLIDEPEEPTTTTTTTSTTTLTTTTTTPPETTTTTAPPETTATTDAITATSGVETTRTIVVAAADESTSSTSTTTTSTAGSTSAAGTTSTAVNDEQADDDDSDEPPRRLVQVEVGGFARLATMVEQRRTALRSEATVTVHGGGALGATPLFSVFGPAADATLMNAVCFDLFALGAQDLGLGRPAAQTLIDFLGSAECSTEILASDSNDWLFLDEEQAGEVLSIKVHEFSGESVGFAVIDTPPEAEGGTRLDERELAELADQAQAQIDLLTGVGVRRIVLVTEIGAVNDLGLARRLTDVDAILGAGSDTLLGDFEEFGVTADGPYPIEATNRIGELVCVGHTWTDTRVLGELNVIFEDDRVTNCGGTAHLLVGGGSTAIEPEPDVAESIHSYDLALGDLADLPIGTSRERFCQTGVPGRNVGLLCGPDVASDSAARPSDVQRLVADSVRSGLDGADISLINSGASATGIPAGQITIDRAYELLPHQHRLALVRMTGAEVVATLEEAVDTAIGPDGSAAAYPHAMGLRWSTDLDGEPGERISNVEIRPAEEPDWSPIDPDGNYLVGTIDALIVSQSGWQTMAAAAEDGRALVTRLDYAQAFIDYIEHELLGVVSPFRSDHLN